MTLIKFQIGKNGINEGVLDSLLLMFKMHKQIRISALKSSGRNRESIEQMAQELSEKLKQKSSYAFSYKIIGFTIIMRKHLSS